MDCAVRLTLSTASVSPSYTGGFWVSGVAQLTGGNRVDGWTSGILLSIGPVGERADVAQHGNYASQESVDVSISANGYAEFMAAGATLENALVEIGTMSGSTFAVRWSGAVAGSDWRGVEVALSVEPMGLRRHKEIPAQVLTTATTPTIAEGSDGKPVPIIYGAVERMTPPVLESDQIAEVGIRVRSSVTEYVDSPTTCLALGNFDQGPIPDVVTSTKATIYYSIMLGGDYGTGNAGTWAGTAVDGATSGEPTHDMYLEVVGGTGAGQRRKIEYVTEIDRSNININPPGVYEMSTCTLLTAWDVLPDATSSFRVYKIDRLARYAVADQARTAIVSDRDSNLPLATDTIQVGAILVADVSSEFASGEDVLTLERLATASTYGRNYLVDGITTSGQNIETGSAWERSIPGFGLGREYDLSCGARVEYTAFADRSVEDLYMLVSLDNSAMTIGGNPRPHAFAITTDFTGRKNLITPIFDASCVLADRHPNAFSPSLADDGSRLNFRTYAYKLSLGNPISSIKSIEFGTIAPQFYGAVNYGAYQSINVTKTAGSNVLVNNSGIAPAYDMIRPANAPGITLLDQQISDEGPTSIYARVVLSGFWCAVSSYSGTATITVDDAGQWPNGTYDVILIDEIPHTSYCNEREICLAASYGGVSLASTAVSVASGRRFGPPGMSGTDGFSNGDPITLAKHAVTDLIARDLDQYGTVSASYSDLPADQIHMVLPDRRASADVIGQMCEEFNWIGSHDYLGREWFLPLFREGDDFTVTNAQIISGTFAGLGKTAIEDVITLPMIRRSWTQADGFRLSANVPSLTTSPASVNTGNVEQYAPGFDSPAQGVEAYGILHAAASASGVRQAGEIDYQWSSDLQSLLIDSGRLRWGAMRKDIATFCVSDTHLSAWAILGRRVGVTHRRYIKTERHGVIVARYWYPHLAQVQLTVFLDP